MENLNDLTKEEKDYYELLVDMLEDGIIDESERNILNKRKNKYQISDSRAKELEDFAKQEYLESKKIKFETEGEKDYYELVVDMLEDGAIDESERNILNKRKEKYQISEEKAKEIEEFAKQEYLESKAPQFETEGEKDYYNTLVYMLKYGTINESERFILNKRKEEFKISDSRAKELENLIKLNNGGSSYENNKNSENNEVLEIKKTANGFTPKNYNTAKNENTVALLEKGKVYYYSGELDKALEIFKKSCELNPHYWLNWHMLGVVLCVKDNRYSEAIESLLIAAELKPNSNNTWYLLGISYNLNGRYPEAIETFKKVVKLKPHYWLNWYWLGVSYYQNNQYSEAVNYLKIAGKIKPDDTNIWYQLMTRRYIQKLIPDDVNNWYQLGHAFKDNGQYPEAINSFQIVVKLNPNNADNWHWLGRVYYQNNQYPEAENYFQKAIKLNPNNADNWHWLGRIYYQNNQYSEAENYFQQAVGLNFDDYKDSWRWLGNTHFQLEDYDNAVGYYEILFDSYAYKYGGLGETEIDALINYGVSLYNLNRIEESIEVHNKVLEIDPDNEIAKENLEILQSANYGISGKSIVSGISKGIDTANQLASKVKPETIETITKVGGAAVTAATILGAFFNRNKN